MSAGYHANLPAWPLAGTEPGGATETWTEARTRVLGATRPPIGHLPGTLGHLPDTIWSKLDLASGCLSRDLGVKMISWKGNTCPAAGGPSGQSSRPWPRTAVALSRAAAHRLTEGQQDLAAQHVEIVGWCGAVDDDPVAVIKLAHFEVLCEHLGGQGTAGRWPTCGARALAWPWEGVQHLRGRRRSHHCSSAGTSPALLRSALGPESKCHMAQTGTLLLAAPAAGTVSVTQDRHLLCQDPGHRGKSGWLLRGGALSLWSPNHSKEPGMWEKSGEDVFRGRSGQSQHM